MIISAQVLLAIGSVITILPSTLSAPRSRKKNVPCPPFPYATLKNGKITAIGTQKYMFTCDPGYFLTSPPQVRCWKGKWSSTKQPKCSKSEGQCEDPPPISGGEILGKVRHMGSTIQYLCNAGFVLVGDGSRSCLQSGHWSGVTPACMDESEPIQKVAERLKHTFITEIGNYSSDSVVARGRLLDIDSVKNGLELVILIDRSSSVDPVDFRLGLNFIKFLLHEFGVRNGNNTSGTRAAVMAFGTEVDIVFNLDNNTITGPEAASRVLDTVQPDGGGTAMKEAIMNVYTRLPELREKAKKAIFMLTDGEPNIGDIEDTVFLAKRLRDEKDFEIFTVGIGKGINRKLLSQLASEPLINHIFILDKYLDLRAMMETIKDRSHKPKPINAGRCGYIKTEKYYLKLWPWLAAIYVNLPGESDTHLKFCTGTLICKEWVITAASCFYHIYENNGTGKEFQKVTKEVFVVLGEKDLIHEDRNQMNFYVESVTIHPDFQPLDGLENNLALIKLNAPAPMRLFRPACLPPSERPAFLHLDLNINASIAGWGLPPSNDDEWEVTGGKVQFRSSNVSVVLEEEGVCGVFNGKGILENIFCAGGFGMQTCIGDPGSPIIAVDPLTNIHHLIGVLSRRSHCEQGINQYAELTRYTSWISDTTEECHLQHSTD